MTSNSTTRRVHATPDRVWALITDPLDFAWRSDVTAVSGSPVSYRESHPRSAHVTEYHLLDEAPLARRTLSVRYIDGEGTRTFTLAPVTTGALDAVDVTLTEVVEFELPSILRDQLEAFLETRRTVYLADLAATVE